jgi:hypothetical protein
MAAGQFYELRPGDVWQAMGYALRAAEALDRVESTRGLIQALVQDPNTDAFVREQLVSGTPMSRAGERRPDSSGPNQDHSPMPWA